MKGGMIKRKKITQLVKGNGGINYCMQFAINLDIFNIINVRVLENLEKITLR